MKKFEFTLSKMLDYKVQVLDKEKNNLMQINIQLEKFISKIERMEEEFTLLSSKLKEETQQGITVLDMQCYDFQLKCIRRQLEQMSKERAALETQAEKQLQVVIKASQEVSGLDKLQEKQLDKYNYEVKIAEELFIAEMIASKLIRQKHA